MKIFEIIDLRTESIKEPVGLDVTTPRFSWKMLASHHNAKQTAYQIRVFDNTSNNIMWNSNKIISKHSVHIPYEGSKLLPCKKYHWELTVWNESGHKVTEKSFFETGFLDPSLNSWEGAQFIGADQCSLNANTLGIFRIETIFRIPEGNTTAGIILGHNDSRLLNKAWNTYGLSSENYICYLIDISTPTTVLKIYRVGYHPDDTPESPLAEIPIRDFFDHNNKIITPENKHQEHTLELTCEGNQIKAILDGFMIDQVQDPSLSSSSKTVYIGRQLNPLGMNDCPTFPRVCNVGFSSSSGYAEFKSLKIYNIRYPGTLLRELTAQNATKILKDGNWDISPDGKWIRVRSHGKYTIVSGDPSHGSVPMLRNQFTLSNQRLRSARLYVTARGIYDGYLNGEHLTESLFNPGCSQFDKHLFYQTYDVTKVLHPGDNAIGFYLSSGWWCDSQTFTLTNHNYYGDRPSLLCKLVVEYDNGSRQIMKSDIESWMCSIDGPINYASFFHGEHYDARKDKEYSNFSTADYKLGTWDKPVIIQPVLFPSASDTPHNWPTPNQTNPELIGAPGNVISKGTCLNAISYSEPTPGVYIYDMGQNLAGLPRIQIKGTYGQKIVLRFGETLYPDLDIYENLSGYLLTENLRDATSTDVYICNGTGTEAYIPRFTFHGYRYIEITGITAALPLEDVQSIPISSINSFTGNIETSNPLVNKLFQNILWSQRSNFISIPTDCPQRNERMGWMGDAQVFTRTAAYNSDVYTFFNRYLISVRDLQEDSGRYPDIAPIGGGFGGIAWESAGIIIPWELYLQYGDIRIIEENYISAKKYITYLRHIYDNKQYREMFFLGDWLATDMSTDKNLIWLSYYAYGVKILSNMATAIGEHRDAQIYHMLFTELQTVFNHSFFDAESGLTIRENGDAIDTQCSYALPLAYGIFTSDNQAIAAKRLNEKTKEVGYTLTTGFIGTGLISSALSDNGYEETAYKLLQQTNYPSWLYSVTQGATTIWERWDSVTKEKGFGGNNAMNSFNHYSLGAIGAWMYRDILGIRPDHSQPGYSLFTLKPLITGLSSAQGFYDCPYGRIECGWTRTNQNIEINIVIPANTAANVSLPNRNDIMLNSGQYKFHINTDQ